MKKKLLAGLAVGVMMLGMTGVVNATILLSDTFDGTLVDPDIGSYSAINYITNPLNQIVDTGTNKVLQTTRSTDEFSPSFSPHRLFDELRLI